MQARTAARVFILSAAFLSAGYAAAQGGGADMNEQDYRKMLDQAMKSGSYSQAQGESWDARLKVVSGTVMIKTVDKDEWSKVSGEVPLDPNDMVKTSADAVAEIYLDDKGAFSVGRNTELEISSIDQSDTILSINFGSLAAKVKHLLNDKFKMQVRTPAAVCAIRGTEFAVEYSQLGKETLAAVFDEGRLAVTQTDDSGKDNQEYTLEKNTEIVFGPSQRRFRPVPLARMARHRAAVSAMRARLAALKGWKPRSQERRAALRDRALKRNVVRKQLNGSAATKANPKASRAAKAKARAKAKAAAARRARARQAESEEEAPEGE